VSRATRPGQKGEREMSKPNKVTIDFRADQMEAMHEVIRNCNDEGIYMTWINVVPDEPDRSDFESIAESKKDYNEVVDLFITLVSQPDYRA
jgi:alcohol dehydrogenase class IV